MKTEKVDDEIIRPGSKRKRLPEPQPRPKHVGFQKGNKFGRGRPRKDPGLIKKCKDLTPACVEFLAGLMRDEDARHTDRLSAVTLLLAYGHGRPPTPVNLTSTYSVTDDFLAALKAVNAKGQKALKKEPKVIDVEVETEPV